jgi:hypothetical protein
VRIGNLALSPWKSTLTSVIIILLVGANAFAYLYNWLRELRSQYGPEQICYDPS